MTQIFKNTLLPFFTVAFAIIAASYFVVHSKQFVAMPDLLAMASTIDLTLLIPATYYFFIRKKNIPKTTILPVFVLCLVAAQYLIPEGYHRTLNLFEYALPLVELAVIGFVIYKVRGVLKIYKREKQRTESLDFIETVQEATAQVFGEGRLVNALTTEISIFHYALFAWRAKPELSAPKGYTYHRETGYAAFMAVIAFALIAETAIFHLLLVRWSVVAAWVLTGLSIYSTFFLMGDFNASRCRPIYLKADHLIIRIGLRWKISVPLHLIESVTLRTPDKDVETFANLTLTSEANVVLQLKETCTVSGMYGFKKRASTLALHIDDKNAFKADLEQRMI